MAAKVKAHSRTGERLSRPSTDAGLRVRVLDRLAWMKDAMPHPDNIKWHSERASYEIQSRSMGTLLELRLAFPLDLSRSDLKGALRVVQEEFARAQKGHGIRSRSGRVREDRRLERGIFFHWLSHQFVQRNKTPTRSEWIAEIWQELTRAWLAAAWTNTAQTSLEKWPQAVPAYWEWLGIYGPWIPNPDWDILVDEALGDSVPLDEVREGLRAAESRPKMMARFFAKKPKHLEQMVEELSPDNVDVILKRTRQLLK